VIYGDPTSKFTAQQNAGSVTPPAGFTNYLGITSSSAYSVAAGDVFITGQVVEGNNIADLAWGTANAQAVTLSFRVRSSLTGTFGGSIRNGAGTRSYPFTYSIPAANTWTTITITIPGDTSGTWATDNSSGLAVWFGLGVGSTSSGTAGAWAAGSFFSATGAVSVVGTSGATFYITGVQLETGSVATPFERRPFGTELALCQRYCEVVRMTGMTGTAGDGNKIAMAQPYKVTKRASPTLTITNATAVNYNVFRPGVEATITSPTIVVSNGDADAFLIELGTFSGLTNNDSWTGRYNAGAFLASAEL
jgi:hypothetical protein